MRKIGGLAVACVVLLAGCAEPSAQDETVPDPAKPGTYTSNYSADEFFIAGVKLEWVGDLPTNTQLVDLGAQACSGTLPASHSNYNRINDYAKAVYCP